MSGNVTFVKRAVWMAVMAVSIYLVMPSVVETFSSWPELERLRPGSLVIMSVLMLLSLVCFWIMLGLCLRSNKWGLMATTQLATAAIARIVPGGSAAAGVVQYKLLKDAGVDRTTAGTGTLVATLLNFAVLFALPVFTLPAILFGEPVASALVNGAIGAAIAFVGAAVIGAIFQRWDRPLEALGGLIDRIAARFGRLDPSASPRAERFIESRNLIRSHLASNWHWVVLASFGKWGFEYLALVMAVRGTGYEDTSSVLLLAFVTATLLGRIPLTPGGLGFVEAGLTGTLVLAGVPIGDAVLATLAYRLVSYWLPIPFGALAYGIHRTRMRHEGVEIETFREQGEDAIGTVDAGVEPIL